MSQNPYFRSGLAALIVSVIFFSPLFGFVRDAKAQIPGVNGVIVLKDTSPTTIAQVSNSTKNLVENLKQGVTQLKELEAGERSLAGQVFEYARTASRWIETVTHYTNEIFQYARQFGSIKGVLGVAMQTAGLQEDDLRGIKEWAVALYALINVKRQFESLWESRITLFRNWWARSKSGIFNPEQDWLDLQQFFLDSVGRRGYEYALEMERLKAADKEFGQWKQELERLRAKETELVTDIAAVDEEIRKEQAKVDRLPSVNVSDQNGQGIVTSNERMISMGKVNALVTMKVGYEKMLEDIRTNIIALQQKMTQRYVFYYMTYAEGMKDAEGVAKEITNWDILSEIRRDTGGALLAPAGDEANPPTPAPAP